MEIAIGVPVRLLRSSSRVFAAAMMVFAPGVARAQTSLIAAYGYNEGGGTTANDSSVNSNTAMVSGATWTTACKSGSCLSFNGTSNFVESSDIAALTPGSDATFEAWVSLSGAPTELVSIFSKWSQTNDDEYMFGISSKRKMWFGWHTTGGGSWGSTSFNQAQSTGTIPLNTLTHLAVVRSGTVLKFYMNGVLERSLTVMDTNPFRNGTNTLRVGGQGRGSMNRFFKGVIDEARIYNRALTAAEIQADMSAVIGSDTTPPVISAIAAAGLTAGTATIGWTTNEASDSRVEYGLTTAYGSASTLNTNLVMTHSVALSGLTGATLYHYRVKSQDAAGNLAVSTDLTFTTVDGTAPVVSITAPVAGSTLSGSVPVSANATDDVSVAGVQFKLDGAVLGAEDTTSPYSVPWNTTTVPDGSHALTAIARDLAGNVTTSAAVLVTIANVPTNTLVAAYSYNEGGGTTAGDTSSNGNSGTVSGAAWSTVCEFGSCLSFNGASSLVESPDIPALTPGVNATFEAWVSLSATPAELVSIFNKWSQTIDDEYFLGINPDRSLLFAWHTTGGDTWPSPSFNGVQSVGKLLLNTLTHIAVVRSGVLLTFYINGVPEASLSVVDTNPFRNGSNTLRVGGQGRGAVNRFFQGVIDEARIYNRALTTAEVQADMSTVIGSDTTAPVISAVTVPSASYTTATVTWTTNEGSDSQIEYGPTTGYGSVTTLNASLVTSHTVGLTGLSPNTTYHFRVRSRDGAGNLSTSGDFTFPTLEATPPTVSITTPISGATVTGTISVSATASDNVGVVGVQVLLDGGPLGAEDTTAPYSTSWNTATGTQGLHALTAVARDAAGNQTTSAPVSVTVANSSVQISLAWSANTETDLAGYKIHYGTASGTYTVTIDVGKVTACTITGLQSGTLYYFSATAYNTSNVESSLSTEVSAMK